MSSFEAPQLVAPVASEVAGSAFAGVERGEGSRGGRQRVRVKICGITTAEDAEAAVHAGADALGFNTWAGSRRFLDLEKASHWIVDLPGFVTRVALCVNAPLEEASRISQLPYVDALQLHGDETSDFCQSIALLGRSWIRAVRLESAGQIGCLADWGTRNVLIDAAVAGAYGGTGARLDLNLAAESVRRCKGLHLTLAGGLDPENVAEAVRLVKPYAVDVASGVESAPGRKDAAKMRDFVQAVAAACC